MLSARRLAFLLVLTTVGALFSASAWSAEKEIKIAVVDITRVRKDAPRMKQYDAEYLKMKDELQAEVNYRVNHMLLDDAEIKQYITLQKKGQAQTDADKAAIKALDEKDAAAVKELQALQNTVNLDDAQKARQKALTDLLQKNKDAAEQYVKDSSAMLQSKGDQLSIAIEKDILQAVEAAAKAKQFTYVYDKGALLFGGSDITDDVIKNLPSVTK